MAGATRRRNFRLFEYLVSVMSDAELRTMRECVAAEWGFRVNRARGLSDSEPPEADDTIGPDDELGGIEDEPSPQSSRQSGLPHVSARRAPAPERTKSATGQDLVNRRHATNQPTRGQTGMRRVPQG